MTATLTFSEVRSSPHGRVIIDAVVHLLFDEQFDAVLVMYRRELARRALHESLYTADSRCSGSRGWHNWPASV